MRQYKLGLRYRKYFPLPDEAGTSVFHIAHSHISNSIVWTYFDHFHDGFANSQYFVCYCTFTDTAAAE